MQGNEFKGSRRLQRLASRIKFIVSQVIQRDLNDPRLGLITVLGAEPTGDLKEARIYVSVLGSPGEQSKARHALESARGFIQRIVGSNLRTRNTPFLRFVFDDTHDRVSRIEALIHEAVQEDRRTTMTKKPSRKPNPEPESGKQGRKPGKSQEEERDMKDEENDEQDEFEDEEEEEEEEDEEEEAPEEEEEDADEEDDFDEEDDDFDDDDFDEEEEEEEDEEEEEEEEEEDFDKDDEEEKDYEEDR